MLGGLKMRCLGDFGKLIKNKMIYVYKNFREVEEKLNHKTS